MPRVYYKKLTEGRTLPAIIRNGGYHYTDMPVYEDGSIDCWHRVDLTELKTELQRRWLVTSVPEHEFLSIYGLGSFQVLEGDWLYDQDTYYQHVEDCVREMNPDMVGLFQESRKKKELWKKHRVSFGARGTAYKVKGSFGYDLMDGASVRIFFNRNGQYCLTTLTVYQDQSVLIDAVLDRSFSLDEIHDFFEQKIICTDFDKSVRVLFEGLGTCLVKCQSYVSSAEKWGEIIEHAKKVAGEETAHERCLKHYHAYLTEPSDYNRSRLKESYEAIPEHERMYLGDMDSRDSDFIRIIYEPETKREV